MCYSIFELKLHHCYWLNVVWHSCILFHQEYNPLLFSFVFIMIQVFYPVWGIKRGKNSNYLCRVVFPASQLGVLGRIFHNATHQTLAMQQITDGRTDLCPMCRKTSRAGPPATKLRCWCRTPTGWEHGSTGWEHGSNTKDTNSSSPDGAKLCKFEGFLFSRQNGPC